MMIYKVLSPDERDQLTVTGRHRVPTTDELLVSVWHQHARHSVLLSRPRVRELHTRLGEWLDAGWPGVEHTDTPQVGAA
jgi:hypothetical protein